MTKTTRTLILQATLAVSLAAFALPALALPGGGDSSTTTAAPKTKSPKTLKCKRNETVKRTTVNGKVKLSCVKLKAGLLSDQELYQQARNLADEHEYDWALAHLRMIKRQQDPAVLTYTGYTNRKAGRLETGIAFYQQALAIKPDYAEAREYLGEAYVLSGFADRAQEQLATIKTICGTECESYVALNRFIEENNALKPASSNP